MRLKSFLLSLLLLAAPINAATETHPWFSNVPFATLATPCSPGHALGLTTGTIVVCDSWAYSWSTVPTYSASTAYTIPIWLTSLGVLGNSQIYQDSSTGDIGIGASGPQHQLDVVQGAGDGNGEIRMKCTDTNCEAGVILQNDVQKWQVAVDSNDDLEFRSISDSLSTLRIADSIDRVYIEGNNPTLYFDEGADGNELWIQDTSESVAKIAKVSGDTPGALYIDVMPNDPQVANIYFYRFTNTTGNKYNYYYEGDGTAKVNHRLSMGGADTFFNGPDGSDAQFGLGTDTPDYPLDVYHATTDTLLRLESGDPAVDLLLVDDTQSWSVGISATAFEIADSTGATTPFSIEEDAPTNSLYLDADGNVGIGTDAPDETIHVPRDATVTLRLEANGASGENTQFVGSRSEGSIASPSATANNRLLVVLRGEGYDDAGFDSGGDISIITTEAWDASNQGTKIRFRGHPIGSTTLTEWLILDENGAAADNITYEAADYGEIFENTGSPGTSLTLTTGGTYYGWVSATAGDLNNVTADTADATADHLTVATTGAYRIAGSVSFSGTPAGATIHCAAHIDGTIVPHIGSYRKLGTAGDVGAMSISGIETLTAGEEVSLRCSAASNSRTISFWTVNLSISGIG